MKTIAQINSIAGSLKTVSFKEFLDLIPTKETAKQIHEFNTVVKYECDPAQPDNSQDFETAHYIRSIAFLTQNPDLESFKKDLFAQTTVLRVFKYSLSEMIEDGAFNSVVEFGTPEYLVRIAPRAWLVGNPNDFCKVNHKNTSALICYRKNASLLYRVERLNEEDAIQTFLNNFAEMRIDSPDLPTITAEELRKNFRSGKYF